METCSAGRARRLLAAVAAATLTATLGPAATASDTASPARPGEASIAVATTTKAPPGWRVTPADNGVRVTWRSRQPVPLRDSVVEFRLGGTVLGVPRPQRDGLTYVLDVAGPLPGPARSLRVTSGGRPLDRAGRVVLPVSQPGPAGVDAPADVDRRARSAYDPGLPGPYATTSSSYELAGLDVTGLAAPVEVVGEIVSPVDAPGARPLVLFLHGRHSTCFKGGPDGRSSGDWPCRTGWEPIPSHLGYLDAQELLASQGYVTVSIAANGVNGQDAEVTDGGALARSELVRHHLRLWHRWSTTGGGPFGSSFVDRVELDDVLLVGHSRGGEGVNRAAVDSRPANPWRIAGQLLIGPTAFGRQTALGVDTAVLLPFCDGDVSDLQGQQYVDQGRDLTAADSPDPAVRSAVLVMGANHNYFNREWTPGESAAPSWDDWWSRRDPLCGSTSDARLAPDEQRNVGAVYTAAAAAAFVGRRVGALALLNATSATPASLGAATTHVTAIGARRTSVYRPAAGNPPVRARGVEAAVCEGYRTDNPLPVCVRGFSPWAQPHFLPMYSAESAPAPQAVSLSWSRAGGHATLPFAAEVDPSGSRLLELRMAAVPGTGPATVRIQAVTSAGERVDLGTRTVRALPGGDELAKLWAHSVRVPLPQPPDDSQLRALRLVAESTAGSLVLLDAYGRSPGFSEAPVPELPRVDVVERSIVEGNDGERTEQIRIEVTGTVTGTEQVWVQPPDPEYTGARGYLVELAAGQTLIEIPFTVDADQRDDYDLFFTSFLKAVRGVVTGQYAGTVTVVDDDPEPVLRAVEPIVSVAEGQRLRWDLTLSEPSDKYVPLLLRAFAPDVGMELTLADLTVPFRERWGLPTGDRETPLSRSRLRLYVEFEPGTTERTVVLPVRDDGVVEPEEIVVLDNTEEFDIQLVASLRGLVTDV